MRKWTSPAGVMSRAVLMLGLAAIVAGCGSQAEEAAGPVEPARPLAAETIVANALREAEADDKAVLVEFGASWCVWCFHFQRLVDSDDAGTIIRDNFVIVNLNVREDEANTHLEHPGGVEMMDHWGGASAGLPFYVVLDSSGNKLGDSNLMPDGSNIGYPVSEAEIEHFLDLIDRSAPRIDEAGRAVILDYLVRTAGSL